MTTYSVNTDLLSASLGGSSVALGEADKTSIALQVQEFVNRNAALVGRALQSHGHAPTRDFKVVVRNTGEVFLKTQDGHLLNLAQRVDAAIFQPVTQAAARAVPAPMPYAPSAPVLYPPQPYVPPMTMPLHPHMPPMHPALPISGPGEIQAHVQPADARRERERDTSGRDATQPVIDYFTGLLAKEREDMARQDQAYYLLHTQLLNSENQKLDLKIAHAQEKLDKINEELATYSFSTPSLEDFEPDSMPLRDIGVAYRNVVHRSRYKELVKQKEALEKEIAGFRKQKGGNEELIRCPQDTRAARVRIGDLQAENIRLTRLLEQLLAEREGPRPASIRAPRTSTLPPSREAPPLQPDPRFSGAPVTTIPTKAPLPHDAYRSAEEGIGVRFSFDAPPPAHTQVPTTLRRPVQHQEAMRAPQQPLYTAIDMNPQPPAFFNPGDFRQPPRLPPTPV